MVARELGEQLRMNEVSRVSWAGGVGIREAGVNVLGLFHIRGLQSQVNLNSQVSGDHVDDVDRKRF